MRKRKTVGQTSLEASQDNTKYDPLEIAYAFTDDIIENLTLCAKNHEKIFEEEEYFLGLFIASDPLIKNVRRHKYAAFLYLPMPRPEQSVFLYNKVTKDIKRLWSLPNAKVMSTISEMTGVAPRWQLTKCWCDAFYHGWKYYKKQKKWINETPNHFFDFIRKQHNISHLSESEYLNIHRKELIKAGGKEGAPNFSDPFDFSKITINKVVNTQDAVVY